MNKLTIFDENKNELKSANDNREIKTILNHVGVRFEQWNADFDVTPEHSDEDIKKAFKADIDRLVEQEGYLTYDVISLYPQHPDKKALREKFLSEHTHSEDEVRFFVKGRGLFTLHIEDKIYSVMCEKNDLISVPAHTPHWFDMGDAPDFTCLRFFNNSEGWVAKYTGSNIADNYPRFA